MKKSKRGLSDAIVSVLIILVGLAAVSLVWVLVSNITQSSTDTAEDKISEIINITNSVQCISNYTSWSVCYVNGSQARSVVSLCSGDSAVTTQSCTVTGVLVDYNFESTSGSSVTDSSPNGFTGTLQNGASITSSGKVGNGLLLSGGDQTMSVAHNSLLNPTNNFTISLWTTYTLLQPYNALIMKSNYDSSNYVNTGYGIFYNANFNPGGLCLFINSLSTRACTSLSGYPANTFFHVVGTYDGSNLRLYLNNVNVATTSSTGNVNTNTASLMVGRLQGAFSGSTIHWNGKVDEVLVLNRAIDASEVSYLYNNP